MWNQDIYIIISEESSETEKAMTEMAMMIKITLTIITKTTQEISKTDKINDNNGEDE